MPHDGFEDWNAGWVFQTPAHTRPVNRLAPRAGIVTSLDWTLLVDGNDAFAASCARRGPAGREGKKGKRVKGKK